MCNLFRCAGILQPAIALLAWACAATATAADAPAPSPATRPAWEISAVFDQTIQENGLKVRRDHLSPQQLTVGGKKVWAWGARFGSAKDVPWGRSIFLTVTDPRFKQGRQPAVDIEVVYYKENNVPNPVMVDTQQGSQRVTGGYWGSKDWQIMQARVDGAFFGARQHGHADREMHTDGFDIRLNSFNEDFYIRSIRVRGYDLDENVDYQRLLKLESVATKGDLLLFTPGQNQILTYKFWNMAHKPIDGELAYTLSDREGKALRQGSVRAAVAGGGRTELAVPVDTTGLRYGVYSVNLALIDKATGRSLLQHESYLGVCSSTEALPKAKEGEFLYGLDMALAHYNELGPRLTRWTDVMGVDIVRGGGLDADNLHDVDAAMAFWQPHAMRIMPVVVPPRASESALLEQRGQALEEVAKKYPQLKYWELGNEPDLPGFWPDTIQSYIGGYTAMYKAIKRGNPNAVVGNGGLSLAHDTGKARSREFIQLVDPANLDVWVYHGHGPLVGAERTAFEFVRSLVREAGKDTKPFMETESGVAAREKNQEEVQARTAIQKMVFAQSVGQPLFMWFRLLEFGENYGSLRTEQEPRPVVLAYRSMVEALRHYQFRRMLDLQKEETEAYLFEENGGKGRALVMWANRSSSQSVCLSLTSAAGHLSDTRASDMYGNPIPLQVAADGTAQIAFTDSPVFVKWETAEVDYPAKVASGVLEVPALAQVVSNRQNRIAMQVHNPSNQTLAAVLKVQPEAKVPMEAVPPEQSLTLEPRETRQVEFALKVGAAQNHIRWPQTWQVFGPVDSGVDLSRFTAIPNSLPGFAGPRDVVGQRVYLKDYTIDFTQLGMKFKEKLPAVVMARVESDAEQTVTIGASADFWMAWYLNGQRVYDTLATGNGGGYSILDHTFPISLRKGTNLLACRVLSGSQGFKVLVGSPAAVAKAKQPRNADMLQVTLLADGKELSRGQVELEYVLPVMPLKGLSWTDPPAQWESLDPTAILGERNVRNFWFKEPDSSKWWRGETDLSAVAWLACDRQKLYLIVRVKDDTHVAAGSAATMGQCDSVRLGISRQAKADINEYLVGMVGDKVMVDKTASAYGTPQGLQGDKEIEARIQRIAERGETVYRIALDRSIVGQDTFFINFAVNDSDSDYYKQALEWRPGMIEAREPARWYRAALEQ